MKHLKDVAIFLASLFFGMFGAAFVLRPPQASSDWASWAQAIGSVGAVGVAILVTRLQSNNDRALEDVRAKNEYAERFRVWDDIVCEVCAHILELPSRALDATTALNFVLDPHSRLNFIVLCDALDGIDTERVRPFPLLASILELRRATKVCVGLFPDGYAVAQHAQMKWMSYTEEISKCRVIAENARATFQQYRLGFANRKS